MLFPCWRLHGQPPSHSQDNPSEEGARRQLHALAYVDGHEGPARLRVKLLLTDDSQAGNAGGTER